MKLCDFGVALKMKEDLSGPLDPSEFYTGTQPWCSKEVLEDGPITDKADIFAYGLLIWEMLALDIPHVKLLTGNCLLFMLLCRLSRNGFFKASSIFVAK